MIAKLCPHPILRGLAAQTTPIKPRLASSLAALDRFAPRHLGPRCKDVPRMLEKVGISSLDDLTTRTVPASILRSQPLDLGAYSPGLSESDALAELRRITDQNEVDGPPEPDRARAHQPATALSLQPPSLDGTRTHARTRACARAHAHALTSSGGALLHRHGLPRLQDARCHPAQRAREPWLVHAVRRDRRLA